MTMSEDQALGFALLLALVIIVPLLVVGLEKLWYRCRHRRSKP